MFTAVLSELFLVECNYQIPNKAFAFVITGNVKPLKIYGMHDKLPSTYRQDNSTTGMTTWNCGYCAMDRYFIEFRPKAHALSYIECL